MTRIRKVEIENFRGIKSLEWKPSAGINCLIGSGDSGKSTILDAIDFCLGARRYLSLTDADFHNLDISRPFSITLTLGDLDDELKSLDTYGNYLRGFDAETGSVEDEPESKTETVLSLNLIAGSDLEPAWRLLSDRTAEDKEGRNLSWRDRQRLAPTRIGALADYNLGWQRGSVLNRISDERADTAAAMAKAGRDARTAFGDAAHDQLETTLGIVTSTAKNLGIPVGENVRALLDAHSISFNGGTLALHNEQGVPLRSLGIGSTRLLIAGLQRNASDNANIILVDELEYGLEPHRIARFLSSIGAKETEPPQAFLTTHSPIALCELDGSQLFVVREKKERHDVLNVGLSDDVQGAIRTFPQAFLAQSVIVCEGATEVGLLRGLDQYFSKKGDVSLFAEGVVVISGGGIKNIYNRAFPFLSLGYRVAVIRDDDVPPDLEIEKSFTAEGGYVTKWSEGRALEDELFHNLSDDAVIKLIDKAIEINDEALVEKHIQTLSKNSLSIEGIRTQNRVDGVPFSTRNVLSKASVTKDNSWFKSISRMEHVAFSVVAPDINNLPKDFRVKIEDIFDWIHNDEL